MRAISPWHLLFVLFASASAGQEFGSATLGGKVADTGGKPLAGATVTLNKWSGAQRDLTKPHQATTDQDGRYELQLWFDKAYPLRLHEVFADD